MDTVHLKKRTAECGNVTVNTFFSIMEEYSKDDTKLGSLKEEYEMITSRLEAVLSEGDINEYTKCTIIDMSKKVLEHIAKKYKNVREGVESVMGGKIDAASASEIIFSFTKSISNSNLPSCLPSCFPVAINHGWAGSSHISTMRPSGERPDNSIPCFSKSLR